MCWNWLHLFEAFYVAFQKAGHEGCNDSSLSPLMLHALNQCQSSARRSSDDGGAHVHLLGVRVLLPGSRNSRIFQCTVVTLHGIP